MYRNKIFKLVCMIIAITLLLSSCSHAGSGGESDVIDQSTGAETEIGIEKDTEDKTDKETDKEADRGDLSEATAQGRTYEIKYIETEGGSIYGELEQTVAHGRLASRVEAIADEGYVFVGWSDGYHRADRIDGPVEESLEIYPVFAEKGGTYTVKYVVSRGDTVVYSSEQTANVGETVTYTAPDPAFAYEFSGWSDGNGSIKRIDTALSDGVTYYGEYKPYYLDTPIISIETEDGKGITDKVNYKNCTVTLENASESYCFENIEAEVRGRGNSSWNMEKKSYRIKFAEKRSMMGSDYEVRSWTLIANHCDKSLSRNALAYELSQRLSGLDFSSMNEFVELYVDGDYKGVYLLCDQIQVNEGRVDIGEEILDDPEQMGFLIELDNRAEQEGTEGYDYVVLSRDHNRSYILKSPDSADPVYDPDVHLKYITDYLNECLKALSDEDWDRICELIDMDSFVDMYIVNEMFANLDYYLFSVYFYKEPGGKLFAGPAWDFDISSGNVNYGYADGSDESAPDQDIQYNGKLWIADRNTWFRRLLRNGEFVDLICDRLAYCGKDIIEVAELANTNYKNGYYARYGKAIERNFKRWKIMGVYLWPNPQKLVDITTAREQMDYLSNWLKERYEVVCDVYQIEPSV